MKARPCNTWQERGELRLTGHYLSHLEHHVPDHALGEQFISVVVPLLHHLVEVLLHVLEHEVECVVFPYNLNKEYLLSSVHTSPILNYMYLRLVSKIHNRYLADNGYSVDNKYLF